MGNMGSEGVQEIMGQAQITSTAHCLPLRPHHPPLHHRTTGRASILHSEISLSGTFFIMKIEKLSVSYHLVTVSTNITHSYFLQGQANLPGCERYGKHLTVEYVIAD